MYNVLDFGAVGDGKNLDSTAIQKAIDKCTGEGGGVVLLPGGKVYRSGSIILKSGVELRIESGAVLKASEDMNDYQKFGEIGNVGKEQPSYINCEYNGKPANFFIYAAGGENIRITGFGAIDGTEEIYYGETNQYHIEGEYYPRTPLLFIENVKHFTVQNVTLTRSAFWTLHMVGCDDVLVDGVRILNNLRMANCDGIDPDHCRNVRITNCHIETADDCIVLKTSGAYQAYGPTENIIISGCTLESTSAAIKIGSESEGDFKNIVVSNCNIYSTNRAISFQLRDQGNIENVNIGNINIGTRAFSEHYWGNGEAICFTAVPRHTGLKTGKIKNVTIHDIFARGENGVLIYGNEDQKIENLSLKDITVTLEKTSKWPLEGYDMRPCDGEDMVKSKIYGVYADYAKNLNIERVKIVAEDSFAEFYGGEIFMGDGVEA